MPDIHPDRLAAAFAELDPADRGLLELALRRKLSDDELAGYLGVDWRAMALWRVEAIGRLADGVGLKGWEAEANVCIALLELGDDEWARIVKGVPPLEERPELEPPDPVAALRLGRRPEALPERPWKPQAEEEAEVGLQPPGRPPPRLDPIRAARGAGRAAAAAAERARRPRGTPSRASTRVAGVRRGGWEDAAFLAGAALASLAVAALSTVASPKTAAAALAGLVVAAVVMKRPELGAVLLLVLVAVVPRSDLFGYELPFASLELTDFLVGLTFVSWLALVSRRPQEQAVPRLPVALTLIAFLGASAVGVLTARQDGVAWETSLLELRPLLTLLLVFPLVSCVRSLRALEVGVGIVLAASVGTAVWIIYTYSTGGGGGSTFAGGLSRVEGASFLYLVVGVVWALVFLAYSPSPRRRWLLLGVAAIDTSALFFTLQRSAWIALLAAVLMLAVLLRGKRRVRVTFALAVVFAVVAVAVTLTDDRSSVSRESALQAGAERLSSIGSYDRDVSARHRVAEAERARELIDEHTLTGIGLGASITFWSPMYNERAHRLGGPWTTIYIHNSYIWLALKLGLVGAALFGLLMAAVAGSAFRGYLRARDVRIERLLLGVIVTLGAILVLSFAGPHLTTNESMPYIAALIATVEIVRRFHGSARAPAPS